ncbi:MAG: 23S rRNA (guanosine(2251)-2'-O)-methyltransferase RlmB [bacterium]|nr:23S rRNA (guanosine(2251)-2'-O)-methyltransferase RlmB [bacterium]
MKSYIYGKHVVLEALTHRPDVISELYLAHDIEGAEEVKKRAREEGIAIKAFNGTETLRALEPGAVHQGYVAMLDTSKLVIPFEEYTSSLNIGQDTALVLLDEIQDPQNVGAIIRSAAGFGISAILIPPHNQAQISGAIVKVSAGMVFCMPLVSIGNVNTTLRSLKDKGFWIYGLEGTGDHPIGTEVFDAPAVFVLGNEGRGIREKTLEICDFHLSIPLNPRCESLNVGASSAVVLGMWSAQHPEALGL